jgi:uncharacterized protein YcfL
MSHIKIKAAVFFCLFLVACGRPQYEYADSKDVLVESIESREISGGFLEISAVLRNDSSGDVNNSVYRVFWFDKEGFLVEETSWRPVRVTHGAPVHVRERSTKPGIKDFTLVISSEAN